MPGEVWKEFHHKKSLTSRIERGREIGVAYLGDTPDGCFTYFAGAEVGPTTRDDRFARWQLPANEYVICGFEAENFEHLVTVAINKVVKYSCIWLEKHGLTTDTYSPEIYYDSSPEATYMELWIPISG